MSRARRLAALGLGLTLAAGALAWGELRLRAAETEAGLVLRPRSAPERQWTYTDAAMEVRQRSNHPHARTVERIVVVGDSVTDGGGVPDEDTWVSQAAARLEGRPIELINLAVFGYDACQNLATARQAVELWEPDRIVYASFTNDHHPSWLVYLDRERSRGAYTGPSVVPEGLPGLLDPLLDLASFRLWVGGRKLRTSGDEAVADWDRYERCIAGMAELPVPTLVFNLLPHVMGLGTPEAVDAHMPLGYENQVELEARYRRTAEAAGLPFATVFPQLTAQGRAFHQVGLERDSTHPDAAGHAVFAEAFLEALLRWETGQEQLQPQPVERAVKAAPGPEPKRGPRPRRPLRQRGP